MFMRFGQPQHSFLFKLKILFWSPWNRQWCPPNAKKDNSILEIPYTDVAPTMHSAHVGVVKVKSKNSFYPIACHCTVTFSVTNHNKWHNLQCFWPLNIFTPEGSHLLLFQKGIILDPWDLVPQNLTLTVWGPMKTLKKMFYLFERRIWQELALKLLAMWVDLSPLVPVLI